MSTHRTAGLDQLGPRHFIQGDCFKVRVATWPLSEKSKRRADMRYAVKMVVSRSRRKRQQVTLPAFKLPPLPAD